MQKRKVAILGSGGLVSQRLQQRLAYHPWFELSVVAGVNRYQTGTLNDVPWVLDDTRPTLPDLEIYDAENVETVLTCVSQGVTFAFSALSAQDAQHIEPLWRQHGIIVFSNASAFRGARHIPLVIPEINPVAINLIATAHFQHHLCATNCTLLPLIMPLAALHEKFNLLEFTMRSEQSLSGGGYDYMQSALNAGKVDPDIPGEAIKTDQEFRHILNWQGISSITCSRVMRKEGHLVFVQAKFERAITLENVKDCLLQWSLAHTLEHLPSAPSQPMMLVEEIDTKEHLYANGTSFPHYANPATDYAAGMAIVVGGFNLLNVHELKFEAYSHNTIRGAAGGVVFLAEFVHGSGFV